MHIRRRECRERGASLVELALILPVVAILTFGTIDLVRAYRLNVRLENAAREGAAFAQIFPNDADCPTGADGDINDIVGRVELEDPGLASEPSFGIRTLAGPVGGTLTEYYDSAGPTPDRCKSDGDSGVVTAGQRVKVEVRATFDVLTPLVEGLVGNTIDMTSSAEVLVQG